MDPLICGEMINEAITVRDFHSALDYAKTLRKWQSEGGFMNKAIIDKVLIALDRLDAIGTSHNSLYRMLDVIRQFHLDRQSFEPPTKANVAIVDDYASIARGLRNLERKP